jgi:hypothetical protein
MLQYICLFSQNFKIVFPSVTEELICSTLAMLDSLSCVSVNSDLLGIHIASPGKLFTFLL